MLAYLRFALEHYSGLIYVLVQFDNSLGRLTAASVHNPRKVIDLQRDGSLDKDDIKGREIKRFKQLLLDVETVRASNLHRHGYD